MLSMDDLCAMTAVAGCIGEHAEKFDRIPVERLLAICSRS